MARNVHQPDIAGSRCDGIAGLSVWATEGGGVGRKYNTFAARGTAEVGGKTLAAGTVAFQALGSSDRSREDGHPTEEEHGRYITALNSSSKISGQGEDMAGDASYEARENIRGNTVSEPSLTTADPQATCEDRIAARMSIQRKETTS